MSVRCDTKIACAQCMSMRLDHMQLWNRRQAVENIAGERRDSLNEDHLHQGNSNAGTQGLPHAVKIEEHARRGVFIESLIKGLILVSSLLKSTDVLCRSLRQVKISNKVGTRQHFASLDEQPQVCGSCTAAGGLTTLACPLNHLRFPAELQYAL